MNPRRDEPYVDADGVWVPPGWWGTGQDLTAPLQIPAAGVYDVGLVGCSKRKQRTAMPLPAAELYTGTLFRAGYQYSTTHHDRTLILSGRYGLVAPDALREPYDYVLPQHRAIARMWAIYVLGQLDPIWRGRGMVRHIHLYAGKRYAQPLLDVVGQYDLFADVTWHWPVKGLNIQEQVHWFEAQTENQDDRSP